MELQLNDSAETDVEMEKLSRLMISFKELKQNCSTLTFDEAKHLIKVNDVFEITKRYLLNGYYSATKKRRIGETRPENPGAASSRKITLVSSDGETFEVDEAVALESLRMKYYIDCNCADNGIPLPEVTSKILSKVIEYCKKHVESRKLDDCATGTVDDDLKAWDAEFVKVDQATLFDLIHAAHYLDIKSLSKLTCKTFLDMSKTEEEFKRVFKLLMHTVEELTSCQTVLDLTDCKPVEELNKWYLQHQG
ncbi:hypothetical protein LWI29_024427 [Acer saccharum]|uniref:SKP1 component POZ domain-containing protein n=1 Tax=Acer saccharum TaxID=4024 RepID=A0AA39VEL0_ACESA|nr:hypothetical protein LWI29_024427 [Acer saccharum]KAK1554468.1 hypothetical protein Q3G72_012612 [Acer saccharum]